VFLTANLRSSRGVEAGEKAVFARETRENFQVKCRKKFADLLQNVFFRVFLRVSRANLLSFFVRSGKLFRMKRLLAGFLVLALLCSPVLAMDDGLKNLVDGKRFMEENGRRTGIKTTASGIQYEVLTQGEGARPKKTDRVLVHYKGSLIDGTEFDSSYKRGEPAEFPLAAVIKGWTEIMQMMPVGSKYRVVIPPNMAYGERGFPPTIGPASTLMFDIELLGIVTK
jgi:hypothetical protein